MNLLEVMAMLEGAGWQYRLSSRVATGGEYSATVWKPDPLGGGITVRHVAPGEALLMAYASARTLRAERQAKRLARAAQGAA